ncbi:ABC transporter substrate-binding protein [Effusibacillus lacus]|uniref:Aliphatic sulfonate ABC transporter substrate-binding protein n=1 Tax=Effusibacillus lacus TaxID=1348429 RepID=A0A292YIT4_9BACL|nr:ABC transporter substrate-binding protein [Effusibacillus lacus]TCS71222.1 NitT/TauT family transport system substrate-binding protein [Effusibacillus lacus]GAX89848.1 aliphatic sulfonate ABC transporter substrate-binding protein [Effusibacillus lacus]
MRKRIVLLICLLMLLVNLVGCSQSKQSEVSAPSSQQKIRLGLSPWPGWFVWYLVKEKGFFEKNGVDVELVWFPVYSDSLTALATGKIDANSQTLSDTLAPVAKGIPLKAVLVNDNSNGGDGIVVKPGINSLQELKGKKIATELGTVDHFLMLTALERAGLKEKDVQYTNMTVNDAGPAFISGNLDAAVLWEPFLSKAIQEGKGKLLFSSKDTPGLIPDLLVFREEVTKNRPEDVRKILNAWFDALDYWKQHPEESLQIMAKAAETPIEEYKQSVESVKIFGIQDNLQAFKETGSFTSLVYTGQKTGEFLKGLDMLSQIPDVKQIVDGHFMEEVAKKR